MFLIIQVMAKFYQRQRHIERPTLDYHLFASWWLTKQTRLANDASLVSKFIITDYIDANNQ